MSELNKLYATIKNRQEQLEAARMAFDLEMVEWLKEEIHELQSQAAVLEAEGANDNSLPKVQRH